MESTKGRSLLLQIIKTTTKCFMLSYVSCKNYTPSNVTNTHMRLINRSNVLYVVVVVCNRFQVHTVCLSNPTLSYPVFI